MHVFFAAIFYIALVAMTLFGDASYAAMPEGILVIVQEKGSKVLIGYEESYLKKNKLNTGSEIHILTKNQAFTTKIEMGPSGTPPFTNIKIAPPVDAAVSYGFLTTKKPLTVADKYQLIDINGKDSSLDYRLPNKLKLMKGRKVLATMTIVEKKQKPEDQGEWDECILTVMPASKNGKTVKGEISPCQLGLLSDLDQDGWPELVNLGGNASWSVVSIFPNITVHHSNFGN